MVSTSISWISFASKALWGPKGSVWNMQLNMKAVKRDAIKRQRIESKKGRKDSGKKKPVKKYKEEY